MPKFAVMSKRKSFKRLVHPSHLNVERPNIDELRIVGARGAGLVMYLFKFQAARRAVSMLQHVAGQPIIMEKIEKAGMIWYYTTTENSPL
jgi:hypothetical protein